MRYIIAIAMILFAPINVCADEDIFADYNKAISKPAEANAANVYNAWGENMSQLIESGHRDGVVIDGAGDYANGKVRADGVGNVHIDRGANVGPIINRTQIKNSTVIFKKENKLGW